MYVRTEPKGKKLQNECICACDILAPMKSIYGHHWRDEHFHFKAHKYIDRCCTVYIRNIFNVLSMKQKMQKKKTNTQTYKFSTKTRHISSFSQLRRNYFVILFDVETISIYVSLLVLAAIVVFWILAHFDFSYVIRWNTINCAVALIKYWQFCCCCSRSLSHFL